MLEIAVDAGRFTEAPVGLLERAVRHTLGAEAVERGEVSVALLDDADIRELNRKHLDRDAPTDVLSFSLHRVGEAVLGDIYVGAEQARRQAREEGVAETEELVRLVVHGTLHVLGWDHPEDPEARVTSPMWRLQEALVAEVVG